MKKEKIFISVILGLLTPFGYSSIPLVEGITAAFNNSLVHSSKQVSDQFILKQRENLRKNTKKDFGPQSPRDIDQNSGKNKYKLKENLVHEKMNLCHIHFHKNAEHKGGEFTKYAGNGDGYGNNGGYRYSGQLTKEELKSVKSKICPSNHGSLLSGDTIEVHYVYSKAKRKPSPTSKVCLSTLTKKTELFVVAQVYVLVNDEKAFDFKDFTQVGLKNNFYQVLNFPDKKDIPVQYFGSTTGPTYNEKASPLQVLWRVYPKVIRVNLKTVGQWCQKNVFGESHGHGVRNLVTNPDLLSEIKD